MTVALLLAGLVAGFIDAIAGGGGLITVPVFTLLLGPGPAAIGTNKIGGTLAAFVALLVYARKGHFDWRKSVLFAVWVALGSWLGSTLNPYVPPAYFKWFLLATCPLILAVVWKKDFWVASAEPPLAEAPTFWKLGIALSGFGCGIYDGIWGPGGGTFMFLSLFFAAKLPLLTAIAAAKLANTGSALTSLTNYAFHGYVHWKEGFTLAAGIIVGGYFGASHNTQVAGKLVRPLLVVVVTLLLLKMMVG